MRSDETSCAQPEWQSKIVDYAIAKGFSTLDRSNIGDREIESDFRAVAELTDAFAFHMTGVSTTSMLCVIDSDGITADEIVGRFSRIDRLVRERKFGGFRIGWTRVPTCVSVFLCFQQTSAATSFKDAHQDNCKTNGVFPTRSILPWVLDFGGRKVHSFSGWPFFSIFKADELARILF